MERRDVQFAGDGGVTLSGWLYLPADRDGPYPAITMAHGFGLTRWHGLEPIAQDFANAGFAVLLHDHRNFGRSGGDELYDIDPWRQIADWRYAISYLESREEIDPDHIGLWGANYAGGHAIVLGATDRRLRAVVAHAPIVSGYEQGLRELRPDATMALEARFADDDRRRMMGEKPLVQAIALAESNATAAYHMPEAVAFYHQRMPDDVWANRMTVRSVRASRMYEPGTWISRVSPTPLMMVVALQDTMAITGLALRAYAEALEPKRLVTLNGGHFSTYEAHSWVATAAAIDWFRVHLCGAEPVDGLDLPGAYWDNNLATL